MDHDPIDNLHLAWFFIGMALGAVAMYVMDPAQGRRRRALARDKLYSASVQTRHTIDRQTRHLSNQAQGLQAKASRLLH